MQFDYYHFALNRLLTSAEGITDATSIFLSFTSLLAGVVEVHDYAVYLRYQVSNIVYYSTRESQRGYYDQLIRPMLADGRVTPRNFYRLLWTVGRNKPFLEKMVETYAKERGMFASTLGREHVSLAAGEEGNEDEYGRHRKVQLYLNYYFHFALPFFSPTDQPTTESYEDALEGYFAKIGEEIGLVKSVG